MERDGIDQDLQVLHSSAPETANGGHGNPEGLAGNDLRELWLRLTFKEGGGIAVRGIRKNEYD